MYGHAYVWLHRLKLKKIHTTVSEDKTDRHMDSFAIITGWQHFTAAHSKACPSHVKHPCLFWILSLVLFQSWVSNLCVPLYWATAGLNQVSLLCPFTLWPPAPLTCSTCSGFSSSVFPFLYPFWVLCFFSWWWGGDLLLFSPKSLYGPKLQPRHFCCSCIIAVTFPNPMLVIPRLSKAGCIPQYKEHVLYTALHPSVLS